MGQQLSLFGADAQGTVSTIHVKAWYPYVQWAGNSSAALSQTLHSLPISNPRIPVSQLASTLRIHESLVVSWQQNGPREVLTPILRTGVSGEDLLITLNMCLEQAVESTPDGSPVILEGLSQDVIEKLQEALDQLVEQRGPEGESETVDGVQLQRALEQTVPLIAWAALLTRLAKEIEAQGMGGNSAAVAQPSVSNATPATASSSSSSSAAAPSKSKGASASNSGGFGLDLSISGFSIKPPGAANAKSAGKK
jgi:hypothetical protein